MTKREKRSNIYNSVKYQQIINNDIDFTIEMVRDYCQKRNYSGNWLDTYNKSFQLKKEYFIKYMEQKMPIKDFIDFWKWSF